MRISQPSQFSHWSMETLLSMSGVMLQYAAVLMPGRPNTSIEVLVAETGPNFALTCCNCDDDVVVSGYVLTTGSQDMEREIQSEMKGRPNRPSLDQATNSITVTMNPRGLLLQSRLWRSPLPSRLPSKPGQRLQPSSAYAGATHLEGSHPVLGEAMKHPRTHLNFPNG